MKRNLKAVISSQNKMLQKAHRQKGNISDLKLMEIYSKHLNEIYYWLNQQKNIRYITMEYEHLIKKPREMALQIQSFLEIEADSETMARQVDSSLNHFPPL